ncbi:MAG: hypothetical protein HYX25_02325 [Candidatus Solibacter usitatus]|nr:hypothetical protein [Candidatus Solibacter usitatus]
MLLRSAAIAVAWALADQLYAFAGGEHPTLQGFASKFLGTLFLVLVFGPAAQRLPWPFQQRAAVLWATIFTVQTFSTHLEAYYFIDWPLRRIVTSGVAGFFQALIMAWIVARLFPPRVEDATVQSDLRALFQSRHLISWIWRFALADIFYVFTYFVFGAIAFRFTGPYYLDPAYGLNLKLPENPLLFKLQLLRSLIYILTMLPLIAGLRLKKFYMAILIGLVLWVGGGLAPLVAYYHWPVPLRFYHSVEILSQNFTTGFILVYLLGRRIKPIT